MLALSGDDSWRLLEYGLRDRTGLRPSHTVRPRQRPAGKRGGAPQRGRRAKHRRNLFHATFPTGPSNDKLGVSKKGLSPLDLPPGLIRTVVSSREPPRAQISIK